MITVRDKEIEGVKYRFTPLMAKPARSFVDRLIKQFGPVFGSLIRALDSIDTGDLQAAVGIFGSAVSEFASALDPVFHQELVNAFLTRVEYHDPNTPAGKDPWVLFTANNMEVLFATQLGLETEILVWCLREQYSDFLSLWKRASVFIAGRLGGPGEASKSLSPAV